jgi:hypothetical protein
MRVAVVNHLGDLAAGAEHALVQYVSRLPVDVVPLFFLFEDGAFAATLRAAFDSVTIVPMSRRVAGAERGALPLAAIPDGITGVFRLARALRAARPDMVLTNSMKAHIIGSLAAKLIGVPCVNYVHDFVTGPARMLLSLVSAACARERLTCSKAVAENLGLARSTAVYSGIDTARYRALPDRAAARTALSLPEDELPVVALVGRIARWKGQDRFIRIAIDVLRTVDAHFANCERPSRRRERSTAFISFLGKTTCVMSTRQSIWPPTVPRANRSRARCSRRSHQAFRWSASMMRARAKSWPGTAAERMFRRATRRRSRPPCAPILATRGCWASRSASPASRRSRSTSMSRAMRSPK